MAGIVLTNGWLKQIRPSSRKFGCWCNVYEVLKGGRRGRVSLACERNKIQTTSSSSSSSSTITIPTCLTLCNGLEGNVTSESRGISSVAFDNNQTESTTQGSRNSTLVCTRVGNILKSGRRGVSSVQCGTSENKSTTTSITTPTSPHDTPPTTPSTLRHIPVLTEKVVKFLVPDGASRVILDMTFGGGGHSRALLEASPGVRLVCLDRDPFAYSIAKDLQKDFPTRVLPLLGRFSELPTLLTQLNIQRGFFDGVLMDVGVSSMQFDIPERGFMLSQNGPLDMRMDGKRNPGQITASQALRHMDEDSLYKVFKYYGEERQARLLARGIVESRYMFQSLNTTQELASLVSSLLDNISGTDKLGRHSHPATKAFMALRILVNNELNELDFGMQLAHHYLRAQGVLAALSFHSLEDTIIKRHLQGVDLDLTPATIGLGISKHRTAITSYTKHEMDQLTAKPWKPLLKHVILPSEKEIADNPRARSAKLRAAIKL